MKRGEVIAGMVIALMLVVAIVLPYVAHVDKQAMNRVGWFITALGAVWVAVYIILRLRGRR